MVVEVVAHRPEIEQVEFLGQVEEGFDIALQVLPLLREDPGQRLYELLLAFRDSVMQAVL